MAIHGITWVYMTIHGYTWWYMALHRYTWLYMAIHGNTWQYMALHGYTWLYMVLHCYTWHYMAIHGFTWLFWYISWYTLITLLKVPTEKGRKFFFYSWLVSLSSFFFSTGKKNIWVIDFIIYERITISKNCKDTHLHWSFVLSVCFVDLFGEKLSKKGRSWDYIALF